MGICTWEALHWSPSAINKGTEFKILKLIARQVVLQGSLCFSDFNFRFLCSVLHDDRDCSTSLDFYNPTQKFCSDRSIPLEQAA